MPACESFPKKLLENILQHLLKDLGKENLSLILLKSGLPSEWTECTTFAEVDDDAAIAAYAAIQKAIRAYYGRSAHGILKHVGRNLWADLLQNASLKIKIQAALLRFRSPIMRRKASLDLLVRLLDLKDEISVHTLDLNLLLIDRLSLSTYQQHEAEPICYITYGLILEAIFSGTKEMPSITETKCKANGASACEFNINFGEQ